MADDNSSGTLPLVSIFSEFESVFGHPESYLKPPAILQKNTLSAIKQIFDFCKKDELSGTRSLASTCPLQELLVENFDDEQIWQEIELQNTPLLRVLKRDFHSLKENVDKLSLLSGSSKVVNGNQLPCSDDVDSENANGFVKNESESGTESDRPDEGFSPDEDSDDQIDARGSDDKENENDDDNNGSNKVKSSMNNNRQQQKSRKKKSQVDDSFFKLSDMLQFLDKEDRRYERAHSKKSQKENDDNDNDAAADADDDDDEIGSEPVDYFIDMDSDDTEEEEDEEWNKALGVTESLLGRKREFTKKEKRSRKSARKMKYADFFDPPDGELGANLGSGGESEEDDENESDEKEEFDKDAEKEVEDAHVTASSEDQDDSDSEKKSKAISNFEKKQQKLKEKIEKLEKANLAQKPWQMSGEAGGNKRPINSLLEEDVNFDHTTTTAPDITEETTQNLEDLVIQRIKDEAWDDVERKVKPVMEPFEYKKKLPLDQEKSKLSLSQIYEQEYLKQTQAEAEEKENEQHVEIKALMTKLFTKLDALSNFHFTPKPPKPELKVISNVPVITMEEVAPVSVSDAMMLAPEEIHERKKEQKGSTEKTEVDRKRERREKKRRQHERAVAKEKRRKLIEKLNPGLGNKHSKKAALMKLEKDVKSSKNVSLLKDEGNGKPVKSSSAFFSRLQDEVRDQVKTKKETKKKKEKSIVKVSQLKL